jgi:hypothetical protein
MRDAPRGGVAWAIFRAYRYALLTSVSGRLTPASASAIGRGQ